MKRSQDVPPAIADANDAFHSTYGDARGRHERSSPVLVVLADELIVHVGAERHAFPIRPTSFHVLKSVAHATVGLYVLLHDPKPDVLAALARFVPRLEGSLAELSADDPVAVHASALLRAAREVAVRVLARGRVEEADALTFARSSRDPLLLLTDQATEIHLNALHAAAEAALARIPTGDRPRLHVVVAGDHQARARSLAMQYFRTRLHEDGEDEDRVTYAESVETERDALDLVGTRRLDAAIAFAFFGDEKRLQRDVLGDAAAERIRAMNLVPID